MERRGKVWGLGLLVAFILGQMMLSVTADEEYSDYSASTSVDINDRDPCSFRGDVLLHNQRVVIDPCTHCMCVDGTTTCNMESCPAKPGCRIDELVFYPDVCCPHCPHDSTSLELSDRTPCSFRGKFMLHHERTAIDQCTHCRCENSTTRCIIASCPSEVDCEVVLSPDECCPRCPHKLFVEKTILLHNNSFDFSEGDSRELYFSLDVVSDRNQSTRWIAGPNLWKLSAWISQHEDGSGVKYSLTDQVFNETDAAKEYWNFAEYEETRWSELRYTASFEGGTCNHFKYFCVKFDRTDHPEPIYGLDLTLSAVNSEDSRLVDCMPLGDCKGPVELVYTKWGSGDCPSTADRVYDGFAVGSKYEAIGGTSSYFCLPQVPGYDQNVPSNHAQSTKVYNVEYDGFQTDSGASPNLNGYNVPCAVCEVRGRSTMLLYPGSASCPGGWTREYSGYLMAGRAQDYRTEAVCVESNAEYIAGTAESSIGAKMTKIELSCASGEPCNTAYEYGRELPCAVCTK